MVKNRKLSFLNVFGSKLNQKRHLVYEFKLNLRFKLQFNPYENKFLTSRN
jgi:hypothetical protein